MDFQRLVSTTKLVNASTHPIRDLRVGSPYGMHTINVDPLGVVEVPVEWTQKTLDHRGAAKLKSTIEQVAPFLVPEKDERIKKAEAAMKAGTVYPAPPPPPTAPVYLQPQNS